MDTAPWFLALPRPLGVRPLAGEPGRELAEASDTSDGVGEGSLEAVMTSGAGLSLSLGSSPGTGMITDGLDTVLAEDCGPLLHASCCPVIVSGGNCAGDCMLAVVSLVQDYSM